MEREYPTTVPDPLGLAALETEREALLGFARECEWSGRCPFDWADDWQLEHVGLDELGCPGACMRLSAVEDLLWQGPVPPETDETIPF